MANAPVSSIATLQLFSLFIGWRDASHVLIDGNNPTNNCGKDCVVILMLSMTQMMLYRWWYRACHGDQTWNMEQCTTSRVRSQNPQSRIRRFAILRFHRMYMIPEKAIFKRNFKLLVTPLTSRVVLQLWFTPSLMVTWQHCGIRLRSENVLRIYDCSTIRPVRSLDCSSKSVAQISLITDSEKGTIKDALQLLSHSFTADAAMLIIKLSRI